MTTALDLGEPVAAACTEMDLPDERAWLEWRMGGIGASECAAALGISPYPEQTPYGLFMRKLGQVPEITMNEAMEIGILQEPVIAELYGRRTGHPIERRQVKLQNVERPFLRATIDGFRDDGRPVEFKAVGGRSGAEWGDAGSDQVPFHYLCQVHHQLIVSGLLWADVAVLIGGQDFRIYTVQRDAGIDELIVPRLAEFWRHVEDREAPEPGAADADLIARIAPAYPDSIELEEAVADLATRYAELGDEIRETEQRRKEVRAAIIRAMNDCQHGVFPDGRRVSRSVVERKEYTVKATTYVDFRISKPKASD